MKPVARCCGGYGQRRAGWRAGKPDYAWSTAGELLLKERVPRDWASGINRHPERSMDPELV